MKKLFIFVSLMFVLPFITNASSFVITPSSGSYTNGDVVTLNISVNPAGSTIYTAMIDAKFSPETFEVLSFTLNDSMLAMKQTGYDSVDNGNGVFIKTGGYTGGVSSVTNFGTLILKAKNSGAGTFTINSSSKLLDSNNANMQNSSQLATFTIVNKAPVVEQKAEAKKTQTAVSKTSNDKPVATSSTSTLQNVATVFEASDSSEMLVNILIPILTLIIGFWIGRKTNILEGLLK
jgi:hypothetical protein